MTRRATPEAIERCIYLMRNGEDERVVLKAAEIILNHGMPRGDAMIRALAEGDVGAITIHVEHHHPPAAAAVDTQPEGPVITIDTTPMGAAE